MPSDCWECLHPPPPPLSHPPTPVSPPSFTLVLVLSNPANSMGSATLVASPSASLIVPGNICACKLFPLVRAAEPQWLLTLHLTQVFPTETTVCSITPLYPSLHQNCIVLRLITQFSFSAFRLDECFLAHLNKFFFLSHFLYIIISQKPREYARTEHEHCRV